MQKVFKLNSLYGDERAFTLVELLIVIAILAVLSVAVVLVLSPAELLKQGRDSTRMSDFAAIATAMSLFTIDQPSGFTGTSSIVYVSIPDTSATCVNLGLPTLPSGWTYACASTSTYRNVNGTGWIPISLNVIAAGAPFSVLPIDPINTTSSGNYYTYVVSGQTYETTTLFESAKYQAQEAKDGGVDPAQYESGSSLTLSPFTHGMVGYWKFDEGSGTSALDSSLYGNVGVMYSSTTLTDIHTSSGCKVGGCASYNGIDNMILAQGGTTMIPAGGSITVMAWAYKTISGTKTLGHSNGPFFLDMGTVMGGSTEIYNGSAWGGVVSSQPISTSTWYHLAITYAASGGRISNYLNGALDGTGTIAGGVGQALSCVGIGYSSNGGCNGVKAGFFGGLIDEFRIYNRALSAAEILALYNATK